MNWKTDAYLRGWYDKVNRKYFRNLLPHETKVIWRYPVVKGHGAEFIVFKDGRLLISVNPALQSIGAENYAIQSLIHEMCHLHLWCLGKRASVYSGHGRLFQNEMKRLASLGAFRTIWG